ncbi:MAG: type IV secretion system protein [Pseudomonadota bacterium]
MIKTYRVMQEWISRLASIAKQISIIMICLSSYVPVVFGGYGDSCVGLPPVAANINYLKGYTPYGELLHYFDISNNCNATNDTLTFCVKSSAADAPCESVDIAYGSSKQLNVIAANNTTLSNNLILQNITLYNESFTGGSKLCLTMATPYGHVPLMCRARSSTNSSPLENDINRPVCSVSAPSCYDSGYNYSQSPFNFSGRGYQCLAGTLNKVFFRSSNCIPSDGIEMVALNPFSSLQIALRQAIFAALVIYTILYGIRLSLGAEKMNLERVSIFVLKIIFVTYFAVGTKIIYSSGNDAIESKNGITELVLPILLQTTSNFASIIFNAGGSAGLCVFDSSKYPSGYSYYGLWDAIDCRIAYYFGMGMMANNFHASGNTLHETGATTKPSTAPSGIIFKQPSGVFPLGVNGVFSIFSMIFGFFLGGNILIVICALVFIIMILSLMIQFVSSYLVCIITLYIMMYISPIFVPMILFNRTKGYFEAWLKISISCALQPAILAGFIAFMLTIFDTVVYKNCEFSRHTYQIAASAAGESRYMSTFELRVPNNAPDTCKQSAGYKMMQHYNGAGWDKAAMLIVVVPFISDNLNLLGDMVYLLVFCIIFLFFADSMSAFAAGITGGPNLASVTSSIGGIVRKIQEYREEKKDKVEKIKGKDGGA